MATVLNDIVAFRKDKFFNGAIDTDWFYSSPEKAEDAAQNFVFHGPETHAVSASDIRSSHRLVDTASFATSLMKRSFGLDDQPFTLVIAGYGTGKSHLALTLSQLFHAPKSETASKVISALKLASPSLAKEVISYIEEDSRPVLVITLNGLNQVNLLSEITQKVLNQLKADGLDTSDVDEVCPRFQNAIRLIKPLNADYQAELVASTHHTSIESIEVALLQHEEETFKNVYDFLQNRVGITIDTSKAETLKSLFEVICDHYCGTDKFYRSCMIFFDEFGKYLEFSTVKPHLAGYGILQDLFEAVQAQDTLISFIGFIQYELNAYENRSNLSANDKSEMKRYITRYDSATKIYLSTNIETIIASRIDIKGDAPFLRDTSLIEQSRLTINTLFPSSRDSSTWTNSDIFKKVIIERCWPLSPHAMWFIYYLSAAGKYLQERSALYLLDEAFKVNGDTVISSIPRIGLPPVSLWSNSLLEELQAAEEAGRLGGTALAYTTISDKYGESLSKREINILRAIVISTKIGLVCKEEYHAISALEIITGYDRSDITNGLEILLTEYNVIEWDSSINRYELISDRGPLLEYQKLIRQKSYNYDNNSKNMLFATMALSECENCRDYTTSFGEKYNIRTKEWSFSAVAAHSQNVISHIENAVSEWKDNSSYDKAKGRIIYTYVAPQEDLSALKSDLLKKLQEKSAQLEIPSLPIICVLLYDEDGELAQNLTELDIIAKLDDSEKRKFSGIISQRAEKIRFNIKSIHFKLLKCKNYISLIRDSTKTRLDDIMTQLFEDLYPSPLTFPVDGFSTSRGKAHTTCAILAKELPSGRVNNTYLQRLESEHKNRAWELLHLSWQVVNDRGVSLTPGYSLLKDIFRRWHSELESQQKLTLGTLYKELISPPYGANQISAQVAISAFLGALSEEIFIQQGNDSPDTPANWSLKVFNGKNLPTPKWDNVYLIPVGDTPEKWKQLLDEWASAEFYSHRHELGLRATELQQQLTPPPHLQSGIWDMVQDGQNAYQKILVYENKLKEAEDKLDRVKNEHDAYMLLSGTYRLKSLLNEMEREKHCWTSQQFNDVQTLYAKARVLVQDWYPSLKNQMVPRSYVPTAAKDYMEKSEKVLRNLKTIELLSEAEDFRQDREKKIHAFELYAAAHEDVNAIKTEVFRLHMRIPGSSFSELQHMVTTSQNYLNKLSKYAKIIPTQANEVELLVKELQKKVTEESKALKACISDILSPSFRDPASAKIYASQLATLITKAEGERNYQDLCDMQKVVTASLEAYSEIGLISGNEREFTDELSRIVNSCQEVIDAAELGLSAEDFLREYARNVASKKQQKYDVWWQKICDEAKNLSTLTTAQCLDLKRKCENGPLCWTEKNKADLTNLILSIEKRYEQNKIEHLIAEYKSLDDNGKLEFMRLIKELE
ncbi:hypothetical protein [uncultured Mailhella sp.]|uniref:hypothetical protein n=1 Tax=uncultured Mailhella sp. TaxID=1981031 RepID=UPI0025EC9B91|nr:hypothetical protein [uncultured Mailhella sp.]